MQHSEEQACEQTLEIIGRAFHLRRSDAMPRAIKQAKLWHEGRCGAIRRGDMLSSHKLRAFYRKIQNLIAKNVGRYTPKEGSGPTPELSVRAPSRDSIRSLEDAGKISPSHAMAAREIQRVVEMITAGSHPKCQTYQRGSGGYRPSSLMSQETAYRWSQVYVPWHAAMAARTDKRLKKVAELVIIDGYSLESARRTARMSWEKGLRYLIEAIDMYIKIKDIREGGGSSPATIVPARERVNRNVTSS